MGRGRGRRDNDLIGQTVRISQGPYKGKDLKTYIYLSHHYQSLIISVSQGTLVLTLCLRFPGYIGSNGVPTFPRVHWF